MWKIALKLTIKKKDEAIKNRAIIEKYYSEIELQDRWIVSLPFIGKDNYRYFELTEKEILWEWYELSSLKEAIAFRNSETKNIECVWFLQI